MDTAVLEQMSDETFDHAVVHHGYTNGFSRTFS